MGQLIREMAIFMILSEMLIFMLPEGAYEKYLRFLMDLLLILYLIKPLYSIFSFEGEEISFIPEARWELESQGMQEHLKTEIWNYYQEENLLNPVLEE